MKKFSDELGLTYTRYADDLTFSTDKPISSGMISDLYSTITTFGFQLNAKKSRSLHPGQRLITTGMVVNQKAHPSREFRRRLRAIFHQASRNHREFKTKGKKLLGWAAFVNMYDGELGREYLQIARAVDSGD